MDVDVEGELEGVLAIIEDEEVDCGAVDDVVTPFAMVKYDETILGAEELPCTELSPSNNQKKNIGESSTTKS